MKRKISRHRSGQKDKRVGSEVTSLWWPTGGSPCSPPLCHPVDEGEVAAISWLSSSGPSAGCWCYVCGVQKSRKLGKPELPP